MMDVPWHLEQDSAGAPVSEPLTLAFVRDEHLRVTNGTAEDLYIERLIRVARREFERFSRRAVMPQAFTLFMDAWPYPEILVPRPPLLEVTEITYIDGDGVEQVWGGSPLPYQVSAPVGAYAKRCRIRPVYGTTWPTARCQMDAIAVSFRAGYPEVGSPAEVEVPEDILHGMMLIIGELYKQRTESVHTINQHSAVIRAHDLWTNYRVYG